MKSKTLFVALLFLMILSSCVTESYDMDKLSGEVALNPGIVISAVKGELTLSDVVEPNDTIVFDNQLLKFVISEDSIINFGVSD
ncbi:MAG TPA: hypothetical protein VJ877_00865, partial [Bacteroidales bacterium]|nr:hypothetical protein [Bacteroidales bacterium]